MNAEWEAVIGPATERILRERCATLQTLSLTEADVRACLACGGCSSTGRCVLRDGLSELLPDIATCDLLALLTPIVFGVHHPLMKKAVDRLLPLAGDRFAIRRGEMHHAPRHSKRFAFLVVGLLGADAVPGEAETFQRLVDRHAVNLACSKHAAVVLRDATGIDHAVRGGLARLKVPR